MSWYYASGYGRITAGPVLGSLFEVAGLASVIIGVVAESFHGCDQWLGAGRSAGHRCVVRQSRRGRESTASASVFPIQRRTGHRWASEQSRGCYRMSVAVAPVPLVQSGIVFKVVLMAAVSYSIGRSIGNALGLTWSTAAILIPSTIRASTFSPPYSPSRT